MGKKRTQQHQVDTFGSLVSKAALKQLLPHIEGMVKSLGQQLVIRQAKSTEQMFTRIVAIEKILIDKLGVTQLDLTNKVADVEDERDGLLQAEDLQNGDTARIAVRQKQQDETEYTSGTTNLKAVNLGSGDNFGKEVEDQLMGMKVGEVREIKAGKDNTVTVEVTLSRCARPVKEEAPTPAPEAAQPAVEETKTEGSNADQVQG